MTRGLIALLVLAGFLAACGVRGSPEPPPGAEKTNDPIVLDPLIK
jgi:hypothetical protein